MNYKFKYNNNVYQISTTSNEGGITIQSADASFELSFDKVSETAFLINNNSERAKAFAVKSGDKIFLNIFNRHFVIDDVSREDDKDFSGEQGDLADSACAPMPGSVLKIMVKEGDEVRFDQALVIIEAMKMENEVRAPRDAIVDKIVVEEGMQVGSGDNLILFETS